MKIMLKKILGRSLILTPSKKIEKKYLRGESDTHAKKKLGGLFVQGVMKKLENIAKFKKNFKKWKNWKNEKNWKNLEEKKL